jgi:hypothetical protein
MLDLTVDIKPCPRWGGPWRDELEQKTQKLQFPYMVHLHICTFAYGLLAHCLVA